jgi:hypothetical protein
MPKGTALGNQILKERLCDTGRQDTEGKDWTILADRMQPFIGGQDTRTEPIMHSVLAYLNEETSPCFNKGRN